MSLKHLLLSASNIGHVFTNFTVVSGVVTYQNCRVGPTQIEFNNAYATYPGFTGVGNFYVGTTPNGNAGYQYWKVPVTGLYEITLAGAQGGDGLAYDVAQRGGYGATVREVLPLTADTIVTFVIGKKPINAWGGRSAGGGGGSFVFINTTCLLAAGGGGGGATSAGQDASLTAIGTTTVGGLPNGKFGSGGAGFAGLGADATGYSTGGAPRTQGFVGGITQKSDGGSQGRGGFGGGGGSCACTSGNGGNGGGYSGGSGTPFPNALYGYGGGAAGSSFFGASGNFLQHNQGSGFAEVKLL